MDLKRSHVLPQCTISREKPTAVASQGTDMSRAYVTSECASCGELLTTATNQRIMGDVSMLCSLDVKHDVLEPRCAKTANTRVHSEAHLAVKRVLHEVSL